MEDLSTRGAIPNKVETPLSLEQVFNVVEIMANFHAWCWCTEKPLTNIFGTMEDFRETTELLLDSFRNGVSSMKKTYPHEFEQVNEDKILPFFDYNNFLKVNNNFMNIVPPVLVHGDFWAANIMFNLNPLDGNTTNEVCAIIDWQTCYLGNCMTDFARLFPFFSKQFLETHIDDILHKYYHS